MKKQGILITLLLVLLAGCSDDTAPSAIVSDYTMERNIILSENKLIERMVTDVTDNKEITISNPVDITNFTDIDFNKIGVYNLTFTVKDDAGNISNYSAKLTLEPTASERDLVAFEAAIDDYQTQLEDLASLLLADSDEMKRVQTSLDNLTTDNYVNFQERLDTIEDRLYDAYRTANDALLAVNKSLIERGLELTDNDYVIQSYAEELDDFDLNATTLVEHNKMYSRGLKIEDSLTTRLSELEIQEANIPEELYENTYTKVSACSYTTNRSPNVKVNIGAGNRDYYAYTNEYSQLAFISADTITLQNSETETGNEAGNYCDSPADVAKNTNYTSTYIISDDLGGVSNAYNLIPAGIAQSNLAAIEQEIIDNNGATEFRALLEYSNTETTIPTTIQISYKIDEALVEYQFNN